MYGPEVNEIKGEELQRLEIWGESEAEMVEALATWLYQQGARSDNADVKLLNATMEYNANEKSPTEPHVLSVVYELVYSMYPNG